MPTKNAILERAKAIDTLMLDHQYSQALEQVDGELAVLASDNGFGKRVMLHTKGLVLIQTGRLSESRACFTEALGLGENVGLWRDYACLCYQEANMKEWRRAYKKLAEALKNYENKIGFLSWLQSSNVLAKFHEEEGQIERALSVYEGLLKEIRERDEIELVPLCLSQILRLRALFTQVEGLGSLYTELISLHEDQTSADLQFEVHHSLMLAEMALIGPDHAWLRVQSSLKNEALSGADKRLIFYDFIEEMLLREADLPATCFQWQTKLKGQDPFEQEIHCLAFYPEKRKDFLELTRMAPRLSWASYLRLLILYFRMAETPDKAAEVKNKIHLILDAVESESRPFWIQRMKPPMEENRIVLEFEPERRIIQFENKQLDLSRKKGMLALLNLLSEGQEQSVEKVIECIWNSPYSPEYYHRLRMTAHRLNQLLFDLTAVSKIVEVNSDQVCLRPSVNFKCHTSAEH